MTERAVIYLRLSKEDGKEESQSISSQRNLLVDYAKNKGFKVVEEFVDDGYSGTNFNRPAFKNMINYINKGLAKTIIVKDLSRFGRNYIQVGYYLEEFFPSKKVRLIALNDGYDSFDEKSNDFIPFKNVINEWYAKDTSKKIRAVLDGQAKSGQPKNTVFPIFGYKYNQNYERIIDEETAPIVRLIFKKFLEFNSTEKVAKYLRQNEIKTPRYYNAVKYGYDKFKTLSLPKEKLCNWTRSGVRDLLTKEEYLGVYKTSVTKSISFKNKKRVKNEEYYRFEGKYQPIISKADFLSVQKILQKTKGSKDYSGENNYRGILFCKSCNKNLRFEKRKNSKAKYYCDNKNCKGKSYISKDEIDFLAIKLFRGLKNIIICDKNLLNIVQTEVIKRLNIDNESEEIKIIESRIEDTILKQEKLFEQFNSGIVVEAVFRAIAEKYNTIITNDQMQIEKLKKKSNKSIKEVDLVKMLSEIEEKEAISPLFINKFIEKVVVKTQKESSERVVEFLIKLNKAVDF